MNGNWQATTNVAYQMDHRAINLIDGPKRTQYKYCVNYIHVFCNVFQWLHGGLDTQDLREKETDR